MRGAVAVHDPVPLKPYRVRVYVDYEFSGLPEDAPVTQHTVGTVIVDVDRGSGKIKRCVAVPHEEKNRKWNPDLINWLVEKQKLGEKTGKAA